MKRIFLIVILFLAPHFIYSQIIVSDDTLTCGNYTDTLQAVGSVQDSLQQDDDYSAVIQIGFPFTFYGNTYTSLVVCDNGYITFDTTLAGLGSGYQINAAVPGGGGSEPVNAIMGPWHDVLLFNPFGFGGNGSVFIAKTGIAPNRKFVATWCAAAMFSCTDSLNTFQIVLHEGSNKIETFIDTKKDCAWNNGAAVHGLIDATSTLADIVTDPVSGQPRNFPLVWTASQEGWEFIPNGPNAYTINQIPFSIIFAGVSTWTDANGNILAVGSTLPVNLTTSTVIYASITGECSGSNLVDSIVITLFACFDITLSATQASCLGDDGTITCSPDTVLQLWDAELFDMAGFSVDLAQNLTSNSYTFSNLFPGTYIARITDSLGYSAQDTIVVTQIQNPITINSSTIGVSCYDGSNGKISILANGGLLPYSYYLDGVVSTSPYPLDSVFQDLTGGTYIVSVMDGNNCMQRDTVIITSPNYPLQAVASSKVIVCHSSNDGMLMGIATGGTPGYSYSWYSSGSSISFSDNDTVFGLSAGTYTLEVEDANGCDTTTSVNIIEPLSPLSASQQVFAVQCKGEATGMVVAQAGGGFAPYRYEWLDLSGNIIHLTGSTLSADTLSSLLSGSYILNLYDSENCLETYTWYIDEPNFALSIDSLVIVDSISCYGDSIGSAIMYRSGGVPAYSYLWDNGETTQIASQLTGGLHAVTLSDTWGCEVTDTVDIPQRSLIESDLVVNTTVSCYGASDGIATISTSGGYAPNGYTYYWSQGQLTDSVVFDLADSLLYGSYYVTTRDALGCEVVDSIYISEPEPLSMEASEIDWIDCYDQPNTGEAFATATGGTAPYSFTWGNTSLIGDTVTALTPGVHTVTVTDARGCTASDTVFIHIPDSLYIVIDPSQTILPYCMGVKTAQLGAIAYGGTLGYTYEWDDNAVLPQTSAIATGLLADNYNSLDSSYTVTVTDSKGCTASVSTDVLRYYSETMHVRTDSLLSQYVSDVILSIDTNGVITLDSNEVSCFGYNDGSAYAHVVGGHDSPSHPYIYQWYGPNGFSSTTSMINNLYAGTYSVTVRDTNNCIANASVVLVEPSAITFNTSTSTNESCLGACDGIILVDSLVGGTSSYRAWLTDNQTGSVSSYDIINDTIVDVCSGDFTVLLTDANDCPSTVIAGGIDQQVVGSNMQTQAQVDFGQSITTICHSSSTGLLSVLNPDTSMGYTYHWLSVLGDTLSSDFTMDNLSAGFYVLHVGYDNVLGCTSTDTVEINEFTEITSTPSEVDIDCHGANTGSITVTPSGGTLPYIYAWNTTPQQTTATATNLSAGTYSVTVTDSLGCQKVFTHTVIEPDEIEVVIVNNNYDLSISSVAGGLGPYTYEWMEQSNPSTVLTTANTYTVSSNGDYYVVVTDVGATDTICSVQSNVIAFGATGIDNLFSGLKIYPNPFKDETTIDFGRVIGESSVRLVDVYGKLVEDHVVLDTDRYTISKGNKANGIYFLEIKLEDKIHNVKLIVE